MKEMLKHFFRQKFMKRKVRNGDIELAFAFLEMRLLQLLSEEWASRVVLCFFRYQNAWNDRLELRKNKDRFRQMIHVSMISAYGDTENYQKAMKPQGERIFFT